MVNYRTGARHDVSVMGSGSSAGGLLGKVRINGDGRISDSADCFVFRCNGSAGVEGSMRCEDARVNGHLSVRDDLETEQIKVNGGLKAGGSARIGVGHINGDLDIGETLSAVRLTVNGTLEAGGEIGVEHLNVRGAVESGDALYGKEIRFKLFSSSRVKRMMGERISVTVSLLPRMIGRTKLEVDIIEGDEIVLEHTRADMVRGRRVKIGPGCTIGRVEYSETFDSDRNSDVADVIRTF